MTYLDRSRIEVCPGLVVYPVVCTEKNMLRWCVTPLTRKEHVHEITFDSINKLNWIQFVVKKLPPHPENLSCLWFMADVINLYIDF